MDDRQPLARRLMFWGAALVCLGLVTGLYAAAAITGKAPGDGRIAVAAHVTTVMSGLLLVAVAASLPHLRYSLVGSQRLGSLFIFAGIAGWLFNFSKAVAATHALEPN